MKSVYFSQNGYRQVKIYKNYRERHSPRPREVAGKPKDCHSPSIYRYYED